MRSITTNWNNVAYASATITFTSDATSDTVGVTVA